MNNLEIVKCINSGMGFTKGYFYPVIGWNNGIHIARTDSDGDPINTRFATYIDNAGDIIHAPFEGGGAPAFKHYMTLEGEEVYEANND